MNISRKFAGAGFLSMALLIAGSATARNGPGPDFEITWYTMDGGGGTSTGVTFTLSGTIGQPDASPIESTGGVYNLNGGFWGGGASDHILKDGFDNQGNR